MYRCFPRIVCFAISPGAMRPGSAMEDATERKDQSAD